MKCKEIKINEVNVLDVVEIVTHTGGRVLGNVVAIGQVYFQGEALSTISIVIAKDKFVEFIESEIELIRLYYKENIGLEGIEQ